MYLVISSNFLRVLMGVAYTSCKSNSSQHTCRDLSTFFLLFHQLEIEINDNSICYYHFDECNHTHSNRPCSRKSSLGKGGARDLHILDEAIHQTTFTTKWFFVVIFSTFVCQIVNLIKNCGASFNYSQFISHIV